MHYKKQIVRQISCQGAMKTAGAQSLPVGNTFLSNPRNKAKVAKCAKLPITGFYTY
jgi:hypothetical protein